MVHSKILRKFLVVAALAVAPLASFAGVVISVGFAPPALPVYAQPICPGDGYLWTPGYWAYGPGGYYWVPGTWVQPPTVGLLWTPGYWGWGNGAYLFHAGYWGPHVGFYGGINYGFGYVGTGFYGGEWRGGHFAYNAAYSHVNTAVIHNTYVNRVTINNTVVNNHTSFNGGTGGIQARPTQQEAMAEHENHVQPTAQQQQHIQQASANRANFASANGGRPQVAAVARPGAMNTAVPARGAEARPQGTATGGFGGNQANRGAAAQPRAQAQAQPQQQRAQQPQAQARPQAEARPQQQAARPQPQARPAPQPHPQAAPRAEGHAEGGEHRR